MFRSIWTTVSILCSLSVFVPAFAADTDPLSPNGLVGEVIGRLAPPKVVGKEVVSFEPTWLIRQIIDTGATRVAISECNAEGLLTCDEAKVWLHYLDEQCDTVLLGIIDLGAHPGIEPKGVFASEHPELMLFVMPANDTVPRYVNLFAKTEPNTFAAAMCPAESKVFGPAFRELKMMNDVGHQPR